MSTLTVKVDARLSLRIADAARRRHTSKSAFVRTCVEQALKQAQRGSLRSFHAQARDLCGTVRGQRDLSTNAQHMDGFGT